MKFKWNWLDTVIICVVVILIAAVAIFFLWPRTGSTASSEESFIYVTFDTDKARLGTYDALKVGDEIMLTTNGKVLGEVVSVEILPFRNTVFDESLKKYQVFENEQYPFCRFTIKASGYINESKEAYAASQAVLYGEEWFLETRSIRVVAKVTGVEVEGVDENA